MSMQHRLPDYVVRVALGHFLCRMLAENESSHSNPSPGGKGNTTYECVRGHSERINVGVHRLGAASAAASQVSTRDQRSSMKMIAVSRSRPRATIRLATNRADPLQPSVRDAMLAAVPSLRAFNHSAATLVHRGREPCSPEGSQRRHHALDHGLIICSQTLSCRLNSFLWTLDVRPQVPGRSMEETAQQRLRRPVASSAAVNSTPRP